MTLSGTPPRPHPVVTDHVECAVPGVIPAGAPAGRWSVARAVLTDQANNSRVVTREGGPMVTLSRA